MKEAKALLKVAFTIRTIYFLGSKDSKVMIQFQDIAISADTFI